jgi:cytochrome b subunit of formate dehydrogenase
MGVALLHGNVAEAWMANPFVFTLLAGLGIACLCWLIEVLGGPVIRLPQILRDQRVWYAVLAVAAVTFAVWRNLVPAA